MFGEVELVGYDEREEGDGFARAGGTFEDCVAACVECLFEVAHVCILFWSQYHKEGRVTWVYSGVGEEDGQFVNIESTSISTRICPDGYTSSLLFLFPPRGVDEVMAVDDG